jgi:hypothetical protein
VYDIAAYRPGNNCPPSAIIRDPAVMRVSNRASRFRVNLQQESLIGCANIEALPTPDCNRYSLEPFPALSENL